MNTISIQTSQNVDIDYDLAGLGERILGRLIDYGIFIAVYLACTILFVTIASGTGGMGGIMTIVFVLLGTYALYDLLCEVFWNGQSIGKRIMKIRVVSADGTQPRLSQFLLRWVMRIVDFTLTGDVCALIMVATTNKKQRLGDIVADTVVVKTTPRTQFGQIAFQPQAEAYEPVFAEAAHLTDEQVSLIHQVLTNYYKSGNAVLVYSMATEVKKHLAITPPGTMNDLVFLETIQKDYSYYAARDAQ